MLFARLTLQLLLLYRKGTTMAEKIIRKYNMTDAELSYLASVLVSFLTRDLTDLVKFGLTTEKISNLQAMQDAFEVMPVADELQEDVGLSTDAKNEKRKEIHAVLMDVATRVAAKWGGNSRQYNKLGVEDMARFSDHAYLLNARRAHKNATDWLADLADFGQTAAELTALGASIEQFEDLLIEKANTISDKAGDVQDLIIAGNAMYELMVLYSGFGKRCYQQSNPAKYQDYVLYGSDVPQIPTDPPTGLAVNTGTLELTWNAVAGATGYKVKVKFPADSGSYAAAHEGILTTTEFTLAAQPGSFKVVVQANNAAGLSDASEELLVTPGLAPPSGVAYSNGVSSWTKSAGAAKTRIEASYDNGVTYNEISETDAEEYPWTPPSGHVILRFRCESADGTVVSSWVVLEVDIP